jgi:hypothetical protein
MRALDAIVLRTVGHGSNLPKYISNKLVWKLGVAELKNTEGKHDTRRH